MPAKLGRCHHHSRPLSICTTPCLRQLLRYTHVPFSNKETPGWTPQHTTCVCLGAASHTALHCCASLKSQAHLLQQQQRMHRRQEGCVCHAQRHSCCQHPPTAAGASADSPHSPRLTQPLTQASASRDSPRMKHAGRHKQASRTDVPQGSHTTPAANHMRAPTQGGLQVACRQHGRRSAAQQQVSPGPAARHPSKVSDRTGTLRSTNGMRTTACCDRNSTSTTQVNTHACACSKGMRVKDCSHTRPSQQTRRPACTAMSTAQLPAGPAKHPGACSPTHHTQQAVKHANRHLGTTNYHPLRTTIDTTNPASKQANARSLTAAAVCVRMNLCVHEESRAGVPAAVRALPCGLLISSTHSKSTLLGRAGSRRGRGRSKPRKVL